MDFRWFFHGFSMELLLFFGGFWQRLWGAPVPKRAQRASEVSARSANFNGLCSWVPRNAESRNVNLLLLLFSVRLTSLPHLFLGSAKCGAQEHQPTTAVVFGETHLITPFVLGFREMRSPGTSTYYCCSFR